MATQTSRERAEPGRPAQPVRGDGGSAVPDHEIARPLRGRGGVGEPYEAAVVPAEAPPAHRTAAARPRAASRLAGATHALLRIGAGMLFMEHGAQKLFGLLGGVDGAGATAPLMSQMGLAGVLEFFGGALLVLGLLTRPVALLLMLEMLVAYFQAHAPQGGFPVQNGGELALLYALVFLFLVGNGPGPWSLDRRLLPRLY
jgi:putative oxidoreductase